MTGDAANNADAQHQLQDAANPYTSPSRIKLNYGTRWIENSRFTGAGTQAGVYYNDACNIDHDHNADHDHVDFDLHFGTILRNGTGLLTGVLLHLLLTRFYSDKKPSVNPLYRNFKTLACVGASLGILLTELLPLDYIPFLPKHAKKFITHVISDVMSLGLGLFALPYLLVRKFIIKTPAVDRNQFSRTGREGWSKYTKTALVLGTALGQIVGAVYAISTGASLGFSMALSGGLVGIGACVVGLIAVPLINHLSNKALVTNDKNKFRNNYIRSGITFGTGLGASIGFVVGTFLLPGIGSTAGMALGGAIGAAIGGISLGLAGQHITQTLEKKWNVNKNTENSWDYATRSLAYTTSFVFAAIGFFVPIPGGPMIGAALGAAFGTALGWSLGFAVTRLARTIQPEEEQSKTLPWTQRIASGATAASILGGVLGFSIGFFTLGPVGAVSGAAIGASIGGSTGGLVGALIGKQTRNVIKRMFKPGRVDKKKDAPHATDVYDKTTVPHLAIQDLDAVARSQTTVVLDDDEVERAVLANTSTTTSTTHAVVPIFDRAPTPARKIPARTPSTQATIEHEAPSVTQCAATLYRRPRAGSAPAAVDCATVSCKI